MPDEVDLMIADLQTVAATDEGVSLIFNLWNKAGVPWLAEVELKDKDKVDETIAELQAARYAVWPEPIKVEARQAALHMVLMFYDGTAWNAEKYHAWCNLQRQAGLEGKADCTPRRLCAVVRHVLGIDADHEDEK